MSELHTTSRSAVGVWAPPDPTMLVCPAGAVFDLEQRTRIQRLMSFVADMYRMVRSDLRSAFQSVSSDSRRGRLLTIAWGCVFALYTTLDDVPAAIAYGLASSAWGLFAAFLAVGVVSTALALALALVQRQRKLRRSTRSVSIENDRLWKDLVSTYGIGVPATVLGYPATRIPTRSRTLLLASFYGILGQGASYTGLQGLGTLGGIDPNLALALGIAAAITYRYVLAVRADRASDTYLVRVRRLR